ncbi:hypothetical protein K432DRAFT_256796, partial [Lepidopterella palustris CBS 459.81]
YLWVDSLCIIQNSKDGWTIQSVQMADIYFIALVTISVNAAADGHRSFLADEQR